MGCVRTMHQVDRGSGPCIRLAGGSRPCIRLIGWGSGPLIRLSGGLDHASGLWVEVVRTLHPVGVIGYLFHMTLSHISEATQLSFSI